MGIFKDYSWNHELPGFKRYNLIYGWNWSGKTTLSNLFAFLELGASDKYPDIEYEIETETGSIKQGETYSRKVRVFNQDYISKNVPVLIGKAKHIFIVGEENKKIAEEIKRDEQLLSEKEGKLKEVRNNKNKQEEQKDKTFTDIAAIISANTLGEATRTYRRPNAKSAFQQLMVKELLEESEIEKHNMTLRQIEKPVVKELNVSQLIYLDVELDLDDFLEKVISDARNLSRQTVESIIIDRLKQNNDISKWVEEGIILHEKHKSQTCEYCNQLLPENRIKDLANHFNEADKKLKDSIEALAKELRKAYFLIEGIKPADKANLYEEIQPAYQSAAQSFEDVKKNILEKVVDFEKSLKEKKSKTVEVVNLESNMDIDLFIDAIKKVNIEIRKHNTKTNNFTNEKDVAQTHLERHYLSTIYDDVKDLEASIKNSEAEIKKLEDGDTGYPSEIGISNLKKKIAENKANILSSHKACKEINKGLEGFLGRDELVFEVEKEGYVIKRSGKIADDLSEGEKTAITFVYFTVHLRDQDFDMEEGIVIVDDPVSSFDSNSLFQAFAYLKNAVKDAKQVFILTHSFDFLRLLLNWAKNIPDREKNYYMIKNSYLNDTRNAFIAPMDKALKDYQSEYHYLFKLLYMFQSDGTIGQAYPIPNIARKALETFLMFRVPNGNTQYRKMETLKPHFDENKLTAIYKFTNDLSHITGKGFDPALVQETQNNVKYLLEMMEKVFPEHYKILVESINN